MSFSYILKIALSSLNGRFFGGRKVTGRYYVEETFNARIFEFIKIK